MTLAAGLVVSRWLHYLAVSVLFGALAFPFYAERGGTPWPPEMTRALYRLCRWAGVMAWVSTMASRTRRVRSADFSGLSAGF